MPSPKLPLQVFPGTTTSIIRHYSPAQHLAKSSELAGEIWSRLGACGRRRDAWTYIRPLTREREGRSVHQHSQL